AQEVFDRYMQGPDQINLKREKDNITAADLLAIPQGTITEAGLRKNINVGIQYIASWLRGNGAAAINDLMEDAATAEISRTQVWQWMKHRAHLEDGRPVTLALVEAIQAEELKRISVQVGDQAYSNGRYLLASELFHYLVAQDKLEEFLTVTAYDHL
ncbi:MAG: malate synthase A, partial [Flavobacteriales bacterium]|nr:malate synthase A [Flavobacteriales bacterium]